MVSTDAGHQGTDATFGLDPQARIDHAYNSYDKTAVNAKALIVARYFAEEQARVDEVNAVGTLITSSASFCVSASRASTAVA